MRSFFYNENLSLGFRGRKKR